MPSDRRSKGLSGTRPGARGAHVPTCPPGQGVRGGAAGVPECVPSSSGSASARARPSASARYDPRPAAQGPVRDRWGRYRTDSEALDIPMFAVESSNLEAVGYDEEAMILRIRFHHGGVYDYYDVPGSIHAGLLAADSLGQYHHRHIKWDYRFHRLAGT